ncbi:MAG: hypothetical protein MUO42_00950 [Anaerolineaceae bacterium]|nr:hypothetical protein [Anaerolineaceae bacterium]
MEKKIPIQNRALAFPLSLVFVITLLISFFSFPIELVMLNDQSYEPVLESEEIISRYPDIISELLASHLFENVPPGQLPKILSNREELRIVLEKYIPTEWSLSVFKDLTGRVLGYINFRIPNSSLKLDISELKTALILKSDSIALDYISALPWCSAAVIEEYTASIDKQDVFQLPPCKPSEKNLRTFTNPAAFYIEDIINKLPASVTISGVMPYDKNKFESSFYYYSLGRWVLRLLPIIAISLLIVIALLLRPERNVMLKWIGRLLVFTSSFGLIGLVIIMIGFDQFIVLLVNRYLNDLIEGFGVLLLRLIQKVGYITLVWVIISMIAVLAFGLFLLLVNRLFKPKVISGNSSNGESGIHKEEVLPVTMDGETQLQKEIQPETMEEIESKEKEVSKRKKTINTDS